MKYLLWFCGRWWSTIAGRHTALPSAWGGFGWQQNTKAFWCPIVCFDSVSYVYNFFSLSRCLGLSSPDCFTIFRSKKIVFAFICRWQIFVPVCVCMVFFSPVFMWANVIYVHIRQIKIEWTGIVLLGNGGTLSVITICHMP